MLFFLRKKEKVMSSYCVDVHSQEPFVFVEKILPEESCGDNDLLVRIEACAINPVDGKLYQAAQQQENDSKVLGYDAVGIVEAAGENVSAFKQGDRVFYAGDMTRPGSFATTQLVDSLLVGKAPKTIDVGDIAALPLVSITAYESLFEKLSISTIVAENLSKSILIIGGAGGVGSIAIQLAKRAGLEVIVTASREESINWCQKMGANQIINHHQPLKAQLAKEVDYIFCAADTDSHLQNMVDCIKPFGEICALVSVQQPTDMNVFKTKSVSFHWEFMFTRSLYQTEDRAQQGKILAEIAQCMDSGEFTSIMTKQLTGLTAENLTQAMRTVAEGNMCGKLVISV